MVEDLQKLCRMFVLSIGPLILLHAAYPMGVLYESVVCLTSVLEDSAHAIMLAFCK